ncbi:hypothetical protein Sps_03288 [Shewanella psychrophila]|uniref:Uncharacterized protein n=1 Tax=Shewanella psychrophila TaxID=225848 RepID=A0A1S6HSG8_9GAMM|nr:hypothetical protein Sps_03288 [Shewanella psychrophila]
MLSLQARWVIISPKLLQRGFKKMAKTLYEHDMRDGLAVSVIALIAGEV